MEIMRLLRIPPSLTAVPGDIEVRRPLGPQGARSSAAICFGWDEGVPCTVRYGIMTRTTQYDPYRPSPRDDAAR